MIVENKILPKEITELFNDVIDSSYQKITSKEKKNNSPISSYCI